MTIFKALKNATWWRHLALLTPVYFYARAFTFVEQIMLGAASVVVVLLIEKVYSRSDSEQVTELAPKVQFPPVELGRKQPKKD